MNKIIILILILSSAFLIRFYKLSDYPVGLHSDETTYGYNAYSLLTTGHDEYRQKWPISLLSFGDYKPPMSAWLMIPTIWKFGLNEFAVRFPTALLGSLTVLSIYYIGIEVISDINKKYGKSILRLVPVVAALLLVISPWHILFSRASQLVGNEVFFISTAVLFLLKGLKKNYYLYLSAVLFAGAIYTYYGSRVTVFLLLLLFIGVFYKSILTIKRRILIGGILGLIVLSPLLFSIIKNPLTLTGRAKNLSVFYDPGIRLLLWEAHTLDGHEFPVILSRFFNNKPYFYFRNITERYMQHFSFEFLFTSGGVQAPFNIPRMGVVYLADSIFFIVGLVFLIRSKSKKAFYIIGYLLISPFASSLTFITPAANRSFNMVIPWLIITSFGIVEVLYYFKRLFNIYYRVIGLISAVYLGFFAYFLYIYYVIIPIEIPHEWHFGRHEMVSKTSGLEINYKDVIVSRNHGPAYIWFLFYKKYDPTRFWKNASIDFVPDNLGWITVLGFDKYTFIKDFTWDGVVKKKNTLYVGFENDIPENWNGNIDGEILHMSLLDKTYYPNGKVAFTFSELVTN